MNISAYLDSHIAIRVADLPGPVLQDIMQAMTIDNVEKENALRHHEKGAEDLPDWIELFEIEDDILYLPRGCAAHLTEALYEDYDIEFDWIDNRCRKQGYQGGNPIPVRPYQTKIVDAIMEAEQGIVLAPTGAGKTVAALEIIRDCGGNALVIVNTKEIAGQWMTRCADWLGEDYPVSLIGDSKFEISDGLTVAIQGTLWSRREALKEDGFFDRFQTVCLDECHHVTARTYNHVISQFAAQVRFGMSATPKKTGDFRLAENIVGPIVVEVTEEDVESQVLRPEIHVIETSFGAVYRGDRKTDRGFRRNNYSTIVGKIAKDVARAELVADVIVNRCSENVNLVLSKRLDHLALLWDALVAKGYDKDRIFTVIGDDSRAERAAAIAETENGPCVMMSTLADEAMDAPRIDRVHLTWPSKNTDLIMQQIGRGRRKHQDKTEAIAYDYRDRQTDILDKQYMERRHGLYNPKGWTVVKIKRDDI